MATSTPAGEPAGAAGRLEAASTAGSGSVSTKIRGYVALTKPRIIELLLITTLPTMMLAAGGFPGVPLMLATMIGGTLAAGAANVMNCILDRDIDAKMARTKRRPLVTGQISVTGAIVFSILLTMGSLAWLALAVNPLSAALTAGAIVIYVVGYTLLLKRRTSQNIVWGGIAGCMPVLIGWSAVTNSLTWTPLVLFGIIFLWTPPHYWPLSLRFKRDYANAGVPMLPVVAEATKVARDVLGYAVAMVACSLILVPVASMSWVYAVIAAAVGAWFIAGCVRLYRRTARGQSRKLGEMRVFHSSILYLTVLFVAIAFDPFVQLVTR